MTIVALLRKQRTTRSTTVFAGPGTDIRTMYVENEALEADQEMVMAVVEFTFLGAETITFVDFLAEHVEFDDDAKITVGEIWAGWAACCGTDPRERLVGGVSRQDVSKLFRAQFGAPEQTRARIDGRVQRCWAGYRLKESGG